MSRMKPTLYLDTTDLPAIKDWETGKTYEVTVRMKMKSRNEHTEESGSTRMSASFEISSMKPSDEKDPGMMNVKQMRSYMTGEKKKAAMYE